MKRVLQLAVIATVVWSIPAPAQVSAPEIAFDSTADTLKWPDNIHMGEAAGVAPGVGAELSGRERRPGAGQDEDGDDDPQPPQDRRDEIEALG